MYGRGVAGEIAFLSKTIFDTPASTLEKLAIPQAEKFTPPPRPLPNVTRFISREARLKLVPFRYEHLTFCPLS